MNFQEIQLLIECVTQPDLKIAMEHPDWRQAYQSIVDYMEEEIAGFYDLCELAQFVQIIEKVARFYVDEGKLMYEDLNVPTEPYVWKGSKWVSSAEED